MHGGRLWSGWGLRSLTHLSQHPLPYEGQVCVETLPAGLSMGTDNSRRTRATLLSSMAGTRKPKFINLGDFRFLINLAATVHAQLR